MNDERVEYWLDLTDYDLETAKAMFKTKRYLYVAFMCHQVIEKGLKAVIARDCEEGDIPPKIHNLVRLSEISGLNLKMTSEQIKFIENLNPMNVEARYPEYKIELIAMLTKDKSKEIIKNTEEMLCWIKEQL